MILIVLLTGFVAFVLFISLSYGFGNFLLKKMLDKFIDNEHFKNIDNSIINPADDCIKMDMLTENHLNFQTGTNIPLGPNHYDNYIGKIYINENNSDNNPFEDGNLCLRKPKLLYDGIWNSDMEKKSPYKYQNWNLTNGNVTDGYYCSNKLIEVNKPFPKNYVDNSATPPIQDGKYYTWFNDKVQDVWDTQTYCFPSVFNAGITEDLKTKE